MLVALLICWVLPTGGGLDGLLAKPGPFVRCFQNDWFTIKWFLVGACRWNWYGSIPGALTNQLFKLAGRVLSDRHSAAIIFPRRLQINLLGFAGVCDNLEPSLRGGEGRLCLQGGLSGTRLYRLEEKRSHLGEVWGFSSLLKFVSTPQWGGQLNF